jgi:hypothetical protein
MASAIRYLAATDDSHIGMLALGYLSGLLRIGRVRVGSMTGGMAGRWALYAQLLTTPIDDDFVNVVCCAPDRWTWTQRVPMPTKRPDGSWGTESAIGRQELYTAGHRNVIVVPWVVLSDDQRADALRYDQVVVPNEAQQDVWSSQRLQQGRSPVHFVPIPIGIDPGTLRAAILPP